MEIDVSKCEYKYKDICTIYDEEKCEYITDCHYKQLQQKTQILEEIQELLNDTDALVQDHETPYDLAKQILQIINEVKSNE